MTEGGAIWSAGGLTPLYERYMIGGQLPVVVLSSKLGERTSLMASVILGIRLHCPTYPKESVLQQDSWLLGGGTIHRELDILAFAVPGGRKDASLGRLFSGLTPRSDGIFDLELAVALPDLLPNSSEGSEFHFEVHDLSSIHTLCVSNRMIKARFSREGSAFHVLAPQGGCLVRGTDLPIPEGAHIEAQKTMVARRFEISGPDAEDALSSHLESCMDLFVADLNRLVMAHVMLASKAFPVTTPVYDRNTFDYMYIALRGADKERVGTHRITANLMKCMLNAGCQSGDDNEVVQSYLSGEREVDPALAFLHSAKGFLHGGLPSYALLQLVIAVEIATTRYVHAKLLSKGVSKSKLADYERDITLAQMLNVYLVALTPKAKRPSGALLGMMNRGRELRNEFMHHGELSASKQEIGRLLEAAREYIGILAVTV